MGEWTPDIVVTRYLWIRGAAATATKDSIAGVCDVARSRQEDRRTRAQIAKNSCDPSRLRVKMRSAFSCSIKRSIAELNSDSHSRRLVVNTQKQSGNETSWSCGFSPSREIIRQADASPVPSEVRLHPYSSCFSAGREPAFLLRTPDRTTACANRAEFISVNGQCPVRSALRSDMRPSKRISGHAAATVPPHAPMNSPERRNVGDRVSLPGLVYQPL
jgi:hypothetical protein